MVKGDGELDKKLAAEDLRLGRIQKMRNQGLAIFLSKIQEGRDTTNLDVRCALLGLDEKQNRVAEMTMNGLQKVGEVLEAFRVEANRMEEVAGILQRYLVELRQWEELPWWKRRRTSRPVLPSFPSRASKFATPGEAAARHEPEAGKGAGSDERSREGKEVGDGSAVGEKRGQE